MPWKYGIYSFVSAENSDLFPNIAGAPSVHIELMIRISFHVLMFTQINIVFVTHRFERTSRFGYSPLHKKTKLQKK